MIRVCSLAILLVFVMGACTKLHCRGALYYEDGNPATGVLVKASSIPHKFPDMDLLRLKSDSDITDEHGRFHLSFEKYRDRYTRSGVIDGRANHPLFIHVIGEDGNDEISWTIDANIESFPFEGKFASRTPMAENEYGGRGSLKETDPRYQILTIDIQVYEK